MFKKVLLLAIFIAVTFSCISNSSKERVIETADYVDMNRFVGDWYVIALIPTIFEVNASNGIENYSLDEDGNIRVEYSYRKKDKDRVMYQKGWIINEETNAEWKVRPLWPLKLPYFVLEIDDDYSYTVIGTNSYDYLWIMFREPEVDESILEAIYDRMVERGYEREKIVRMKHQE